MNNFFCIVRVKDDYTNSAESPSLPR